MISGPNSRLSRHAWMRIARFTGLILAASVAGSIILTNVFMEMFSEGINLQGLLVAITMPIVLGGPILLLLFHKQEQLHHANAQLQQMATIDWLTSCLNRGAFTAEVSRRLRFATWQGALFVIDVDHFKAINDKHGHDRGDDALRLIADAITRAAGESALIGRLGGEEFGVFLPNTTEDKSRSIAENIRDAVADVAFIVSGARCALSVSIGGASFAGNSDFRALYRLADDQLYQAKNAGRDRVALWSAA